MCERADQKADRGNFKYSMKQDTDQQKLLRGAAGHRRKPSCLLCRYASERVTKADHGGKPRCPRQQHTPEEAFFLQWIHISTLSVERSDLLFRLCLLPGLRRSDLHPSRPIQERRPAQFFHWSLPAERLLYRHLRYRVHDPLKILLPYRGNLRVRSRIHEVNCIRDATLHRKLHGV